MWDAEKSRDAYPTREAFMYDLVDVLRAELLAIKAAGATVAQFDDPHLCLFVDESVRGQYEHPEREMDLCVDLLNQIVDGVSGIQIAIHLCRRNKGREGWVGEGGYEPILQDAHPPNADRRAPIPLGCARTRPARPNAARRCGWAHADTTDRPSICSKAIWPCR